MAFDPLEGHSMSPCQHIQLPPKVFILHREQSLPRSPFPAVCLPFSNPLGDALLDVLGICEQLDIARSLQLSECSNGSHEFHSIVGGGGIAARDFLAQSSADEDGSPTAGSRIAATSSVSINGYDCHDEQGYRIP